MRLFASVHYGVAVIPARPRKPKDKAKVEGAVLIVQRWILARLRRHKFFSLDELNQAIWELLDELNARPFQKLEGCRNSAFEKLDPAHRPENHRDQLWPPERLISWGAKFGPAVATVVELTIGRYVNAEQGYRACLGLVRTAERYGAMRMNAACERALSVRIPGGPKRKYIEAILKKGLDLQPQSTAPNRGSVLQHENVRGSDYYDRKETIH